MNSRFPLALFLVALTGFISLSYEICWVRIYSFVSGSRAWVFGAMLGMYLIGLAFGSLWSLRWRRESEAGDKEQLIPLAAFVLCANILGFLVTPLVSWLVVFVPFLLTLPLIGVSAALFGATLPLICHFAISPREEVGSRLSYLYLANILGSGAGSLLTGFVFMEHGSMAGINALLLSLGLLLSCLLFILAGGFSSRSRGKYLALLVAGIVALASTTWLFGGLYERLQFKNDYSPGDRFALVVESRSGVISIDQENKIYGGGVFDGVLNTSPVGAPWLVRPYFLSAVHDDPRDVLVIGMSGGTWSQILANHPQVRSVTIVEINGAYAERVVPEVPSSRSLLENPKVKIITDDGRRWLRANPDIRFDAIVSNTTFHYREFASALLSREFFEQLRKHLAPGGIAIVNTTGSNRAIATAMHVFDHCALLLNNVVVSNQPLRFSRSRWETVLADYQIDGKYAFPRTPEGEQAMLSYLDVITTKDQMDVPTSQRLWTMESLRKDHGVMGAKIITDDNLGHEFEK